MSRGGARAGPPAWSKPSLRWAGLAAAALLLIGVAIAWWPTRTRVIVLGDSHVKGIMSRPQGPSFVEVLREELGPRYEVLAAGCPGSTAYSWTHDGTTLACSFKNAYPELASPHLPAEIVVILLGSNDAMQLNKWEDNSPKAYAEEMQKLVARTQRDGGQRILLLGPPPNPAGWKPIKRLLRQYSEALAELAQREPNVYMGPDLQEFIDPKKHFAGRKVHMNALGHRLVGERLAVAIRALEDPGGGSAAAEAR